MPGSEHLAFTSWLAFAAALSSAACQRSGGGSADAALLELRGEGFPLEVRTFDGRWHRLERPPTLVLPTSSSSADLVLDLLGPGAVAALPAQADAYSPAWIALAERPDLPRFERYTAEGLLGLGADLVLAHPWAAPEASSIFASQGVPVLLLREPSGLSDLWHDLERLGRILGVPERGVELRAHWEGRARAVLARPRFEGQRALAYSQLGTGAWSAGAGTLEDLLFELVGLQNAAAEGGLRGHVPLDAERLLVIDPDWIVVPSNPGQSERSASRAHLLGDPRLARLRAVRSGNLVVMPSHLSGCSSHRVIEAAELLRERVERRR